MIVLETERLYLREWVPDDWIRFKPLVVEPRVIQYINQGGPWPDHRIQTRVLEYIHFGQTRGWHLWPVIHRADAALIGFCGFSDGRPPDVEIGWRLLPDYWGQGLATEAAKATLDYGFRSWSFSPVIAVAQTPNRASIRVMEKIGMTFDGTMDDRGAEVVRYVARNPRHDSRAVADSLAGHPSPRNSDAAMITSYQRRPIRFLDLWTHGAWRLKLYGISSDRAEPRNELIDAAKDVAADRLASIPASMKHYSVGFLGVHDGKTANFVFVDWWADENELHHHVYISPTEDPARLEYATPSGLVACVWDLRLMDFERQAWLDTVLQRGGSPDLDAYLEQRLNEDV
jgi:RimJ/RimL family protein N-acetyltransferase